MTLTQAETAVLRYLGSDATDPPITQAELWAMINEAYYEYVARFTSVWKTEAMVNSSSPSGRFFYPPAGGGQWIDIETMEVWDNLTYDPDTGLEVWVPLKRRTVGQVAYMRRSIGANAFPQIYALEMVSESMTALRTNYRVSIYPIPLTVHSYRGRIRVFPTADLVAGGDVLQYMDDPQGEQLAIWVAGRLAELLGYPEDQVKRLAGLLPPRIAAEFDMMDALAWPISESRHVGHVVEE